MPKHQAFVKHQCSWRVRPGKTGPRLFMGSNRIIVSPKALDPRGYPTWRAAWLFVIRFAEYLEAAQFGA